MKKCFTILFVLIHLWAGIANQANAQVTGVKTIPGDYSTLAQAVLDLNTVGVGAGGATIELRQPEEAPPGGYLLGTAVLNASLSAANPLIINGNNNTLTAFTGTNNNTDGIFKILGADYVTIDGLNLAEKSSNNNSTTRMEWGYALLKLNSTLPYDGCQHVTIRNCTIALNYTTGTVVGIRSASHQDGVTTALSPTGATADDGNSHNRFYGNTITGVQWGIQLLGLNNVSVYDTANTVGVPTGNHITVGIVSGNTSASVYGVYYSNNKGATVHNNILRTTPSQRGTIDAVFLERGEGAVSVRDNHISLKPALSSISGIVSGIRYGNFTGPDDTVIISGNQFRDWNVGLSTNQSLRVIDAANNSLYKAVIVKDNIIDSIVVRTNGTLYVMNMRTGQTPYLELSGNRITNLYKFGSASNSGGIYVADMTSSSSALKALISNNEVEKVVCTLTAANSPVTGIRLTSSSGGEIHATKNVIRDVSAAGENEVKIIAFPSSGSVVDFDFNEIVGVRAGGFTEVVGMRGRNVHNNKLYDVMTTGGNLHGYYHVSQGSVNFHNNIIAGFRHEGTSGIIRLINLNWARNASALYNNFIEGSVGSSYQTNAEGGFCGIYTNTNSAYTFYHNTIKIAKDGLSTGDMGAAAIWAYSSSSVLKIYNNVFHVDVTPSGSNFTTAIYRRISSNPTAANFDADANIYYVPTAANSYIYADRSNTFGPFNDPAFNKTCGVYKTFMRSLGLKEQNSYLENNLVAGTIPGTFVPSGASYAKGVGVATVSPAVTTDYSGAARPNPGSDAGALQFAGTPADVVPPVITYTPLPASSCDTLPPVLVATITDNISIPVSPASAPRLYYRKDSEQNAFGSYPADNNASFNGWKYVTGTNVGGNDFHFNFDYSLLTAPVAAGEVIHYFVIAQDDAGNAHAVTVGFPAAFCMGGVNLTAAAGPVEAAPTVNSFTIQDNALQSLTPPGPVSLCGGNGVDLEVTGAASSYIWYRNDTLIGGAVAAIYRADSAGDYHAFVTSATCFYTTTATTVATSVAPVISVVGQQGICAGDTTLLYTDSSIAGRSYAWLRDGQPVSGVLHASLPVTLAGGYEVVVTGGGCADTSLPVSIQVLAAPDLQVTTATGDTVFCAGSSIGLQAVTGQAAYRWKRNGTDLATGGAGPTYNAAEPGEYQVVITAASGCVDSSAPLTIIADTAHATVTMSGGNTVCSNDSLELHALQVPGYAYVWKKDGVVLPVTTPSLTAKQSGAYKVIVTTSYGCVDSSSAASLVVDTAGATLTVSGSLTFCKDDSVLLAAPVATGYTYVWKKDNVILPFTGSTYAAKQSGSYKVIVTTPNNCTDSSAAVRVVSDTVSAILTHTNPTVFCKNDSVVLTAQQRPDYRYAWQKDGVLLTGNSETYTAKHSGAYRLIVSNANNCADSSAAVQLLSDTAQVAVTHTTPLTFCRADSVVLTTPVVPGYSYAWYKDGAPIPATTNIFAAKQTGTYRVVATTLNGCKDTSAVFSVISDTANVAVSPSGPLTFCKDDSVRLAAHVGFGYSYAWEKDGVTLPVSGHSYTAKESGSYRVVITTGNNCSDSSALFFVVSDTASATLSASGPVIFCDGDSVILEATVFAGYSYAWHHNGTALPGAGNSRYAATIAGDYKVIATTANGCSDTSDAITVIVNTMPVASLMLDGDSVFCSGNTATLITSGGLGYTWQWRRNGQEIANANDSFYLVQFSGAYDVIVSAGNSCEDTSVTREIVVIPSPVPGIIAVDPRMKTGSQYVTYQWYLNGVPIDGATDSTYTAGELGAYTVEVTDSSGCKGMSLVYNLHTLDFVDVADPELLSGQIQIYPNPASSFVRIDAPFSVHVCLYSMDGKMVLQRQHVQDISLEGLADGVYMIHISNDAGIRIRAERIMKVSR